MREITSRKRVDLNIPIRIIKSYKNSKEEKELLAFAIFVKVNYVDSCIRDVTVKHIMDSCGISFGRAKRILSGIANDGFLFTGNGNKITANSFKDKGIKENRKGQTFYSDYCYKFPIAINSFKNIIKEIPKILIENTINACDRRLLSTKENCNVEITQKQLANSTGISRSYISKITKQMAGYNGTISKEKAKIKFAMGVVNEETVKEFKKATGRRNFIINPNDGSAFYVEACKYSIKDRTETNRFQHVIYDQWLRLKSIACDVATSVTNINIMDTELMSAYS